MSNIYKIPRDSSIRNILIFLCLYFMISYIFSKLYMFLFATACVMVGYVIWYIQRNVEIEVFEDCINIRKLKSTLLPDKTKTVYFKDIVKIKRTASVFRRFHTIVMSNGKCLHLPAEVNKEFDLYIENLKTII